MSKLSEDEMAMFEHLQAELRLAQLPMQSFQSYLAKKYSLKGQFFLQPDGEIVAVRDGENPTMAGS